MGIRSKLVFLTVLLTLIVAAGPMVMSFVQHQETVTNDIEARGELIGRELALQLSALHRQLGSIHDPVGVAAARDDNEDVIAAFALDTDGSILTDGSDRVYDGTEKIKEFTQVQGSVLSSRAFQNERQGEKIQISGPVIRDGSTIGYVHLVASTARARTTATGALVQQAMVLGGMALVGAILASLLFQCVSRPLQRLLAGALEMEDGNFKVQIDVKSKRNELGKLAKAMTNVATGLRATTVSKRYLDEVLQSMADSLIVVDTDANIVTVNRATVEMLGYPEKNLVGQPASLICIDEGYQLTGSRLHHLLGEQTQQDYELHYRSSDGESRPISFSGSPIRDNNGEVVGYVCIGKDITERKRNEDEREQLNKKLVDTSRQAGMAEVATGVLHNVGNVLNSVNMSASLVADSVRRSKVAGLTKAVELINSQQDVATFIRDDAKGKQLPKYLGQVAEHLVSEQSSILEELSSLTQNINHIKDIISMQQSYSKVAGVIEPLDMTDAIEEAIRMNASSLEAHQVKIVRKFERMDEVPTDKHKILQVLVNLITNAKDAMKELHSERTLTIELRKDLERDMAVISVKDVGIGIPPENLTRIFTHGFTTKKKGNGFGLHSSALTANELGGSLEVASDGPGEGAVFTVTLPLHREATVA